MSVGPGAALIEASQSLSQLGIVVPQPLDLFGFFKCLGGAAAVLSALEAFDAAEGLRCHIGYLASKAATRPAQILSGEPFAAERKIILEALANVSATLRTTVANWTENVPDGIPTIVFALIRAAGVQLEGTCSRDKALFLARTILAERPQQCVEIGVLGGRSIIACAGALREVGCGSITAVETWSPDTTIANPTDDASGSWWSQIDFPRVKREFYRFVAAVDLTQQVRILEARPGRAAVLFDQIDFLHIDGSQCVSKATEAALLYASKVRHGGIVVLDHVDWTGAEPAWDILRDLCDVLTTLGPPQLGMERCVVLRRR
jgi:predicted O-methyltransferase YrrM